MKQKTQLEAVKAELKKGKTLTPLIAFKTIGTFRLASHIWVLRKRGMKIKGKLVKFKTKYGTKGQYMAYKKG